MGLADQKISDYLKSATGRKNLSKASLRCLTGWVSLRFLPPCFLLGIPHSAGQADTQIVQLRGQQSHGAI